MAAPSAARFNSRSAFCEATGVGSGAIGCETRAGSCGATMTMELGMHLPSSTMCELRFGQHSPERIQPIRPVPLQPLGRIAIGKLRVSSATELLLAPLATKPTAMILPSNQPSRSTWARWQCGL